MNAKDKNTSQLNLKIDLFLHRRLKAAAAMEGALLGVPSIALSQVHGFGHVHWDTAETYLERVLEGVLAAGFETYVGVGR